MYPISRPARALVAAACLVGAGVFAAVALAATTVTTNRGCYLVGKTVKLSGAGFAPFQTFTVMIDGVFLGTRSANSQGTFAIPIHPGGLPTGAAQHVDRVTVSDGADAASTAFTLTRSPGARVTALRGSPPGLSVRFQVWGFSLSGATRAVFVHYVGPAGNAVSTVRVGRTSGQCGYLLSSRRPLFPFHPSHGGWTLQIDTRSFYSRRPGGPLSMIHITVG